MGNSCPNSIPWKSSATTLMTQKWNPNTYLIFEKDRSRPAIDLLSQISLDTDGGIVDLGCGPGNITKIIRDLWPNRSLTGIDISEEMINEAKKKYQKTDIHWMKADIAHWVSDEKLALIFSNAALQWIPNHEILFLKIIHNLKSNGILGIQIPLTKELNFQKAIRKITCLPKWKNYFKNVKQINNSIKINKIYQILSNDCKDINIWKTNYYHILEGNSPVTEWIKGTGLTPYLSTLSNQNKNIFLDEYKELINNMYPKQKDKKTILKMKRLFIVAKKK